MALALDIQESLDEIGFDVARFAALLNVSEERVDAWLQGREEPPPAVYEVLKQLMDIKGLAAHVQCSLER